MRKTYVAIVRDHSASMRGLANGAANDFNLLLDGINSAIGDQSVEAAVVECGVGYGGSYRLAQPLTNIKNVQKISNYHADGSGTPLWDSVDMAINSINSIYAQSDAAFLVMVITDGENNNSRMTASTLATKIRQLQATDRWTFTFRVPKGYKQSLVRQLGIPEGNIMEWEQSEKALIQSSQATVAGVQDYFAGRARGETKKNTFYADLANVSPDQVKAQLVDVSKEFKPLFVNQVFAGEMIRDFVERHIGNGRYQLGSAYYQLSKPEKVQQQKMIAIRDRKSGKIYTGTSARDMLGIPHWGEIKLIPGNFGQYDIFVQSTSVNRKIVPNTTILYKN